MYKLLSHHTKQGENSNSTAALFFIRYFYDSNNITEFNYTFTPLTESTSYVIYYAIGNILFVDKT